MPARSKRAVRWPIDDKWKRDVQDEMDRRGWSQADLARVARCTQAAISFMLLEDTDSSQLVPAIHKAFGWPPPTPVRAGRDELEVSWESFYERLMLAGGQEAVKRVLDHADLVIAARRPPDKPK